MRKRKEPPSALFLEITEHKNNLIKAVRLFISEDKAIALRDGIYDRKEELVKELTLELYETIKGSKYGTNKYQLFNILETLLLNHNLIKI